MSTSDLHSAPAPLEAVLITSALVRRPRRAPDHAAENRALSRLARALAEGPAAALARLAESALALCRAGSAGVSLLEKTPRGEVFRAAAIAGALASSDGAATPRAASPCGACLERRAPQLFSYPARHFAPMAR